LSKTPSLRNTFTNLRNLHRLLIKMAGLVSYASSDEEDDVQEPVQPLIASHVSRRASQYNPEQITDGTDDRYLNLQHLQNPL
jgi:hypothetical protein